VPGGSSKVEEGRFLEALCLLRDAAPRRRLLRTLPPPIATPLRAPPRGGEKWEGVVGDMWALPPPIAESPEPTRGGGGERTSPRVRRVPSNAPAAHRLARIVDWRGQGSDFAAEGGGGTGSSAPPARAARTATPPRWGAFRPPCLVSACACQPAGRSGRPPRPGRKAAARAAKMPGPGSPAARAGRSLLLGRGDGRGRAAGRWLVGSLRQVTWAMPVSTARRMQYNNLAARHVEQVLPARERRRLAAARPRACGERADGEGLEAEPAPPRGWRGPLQHHLGRTSRSRHAPPRGAARPGEGGGGTVRGAPAAA
ncbi:unnamed protein product, partial [Prorocentrum cordatum]